MKTETVETLTKIRSRGHWRVVIRPGAFVQERLEFERLEKVVRDCTVHFRGWDFPNVEASAIERGIDFFGKVTDWHQHLEVWRFYQSGQFFFSGSLWEDWLDHSVWEPPPPKWTWGKVLNVMGAVSSFTEIFEFASRLALSLAGADGMVVDVGLHRLKGRLLSASMPRVMFTPYRTDLDDYPQQQEFSKEQLIAEPRPLALQFARNLFVRFGWHPSPEMLQGMQDELPR